MQLQHVVVPSCLGSMPWPCCAHLYFLHPDVRATLVRCAELARRYDNNLGFPESKVKESWSKVARTLCGEWNIIAADLQNEVMCSDPALIGSFDIPHTLHASARVLMCTCLPLLKRT